MSFVALVEVASSLVFEASFMEELGVVPEVIIMDVDLYLINSKSDPDL